VISVVIASIDATRYAGATHSLARSLEGAPHELVGIHNARSLCDGWSRGLARARGETVVFCHDDIVVHASGLAERLARHLARYDVVGVAGTRRCVGMDWSEAGIDDAQGAIVQDRGDGARFHFYGADADAGGDAVAGMQSLDGVFLAWRRAAIEAIGFDGVTFDGWHGYDADLTFRAHLAGRKLAVALDVPIVHYSRNVPDEARMRYHLRFAAKHAGRLASGRGAWVDVHEPIAVPDGIDGAWRRDNLARLQAWTRREAQRLRELASRPYAAGRNDPCPCGNGLRYRDCHGRRS
jgi:GT2 family glycosyltransferase